MVYLSNFVCWVARPARPPVIPATRLGPTLSTQILRPSLRSLFSRFAGDTPPSNRRQVPPPPSVRVHLQEPVAQGIPVPFLPVVLRSPSANLLYDGRTRPPARFLAFPDCASPLHTISPCLTDLLCLLTSFLPPLDPPSLADVRMLAVSAAPSRLRLPHTPGPGSTRPVGHGSADGGPANARPAWALDGEEGCPERTRTGLQV